MISMTLMLPHLVQSTIDAWIVNNVKSQRKQFINENKLRSRISETNEARDVFQALCHEKNGTRIEA